MAHNSLIYDAATTTAALDSGVLSLLDYQWVSIIAKNGDGAGRTVTVTTYADDKSTALWAMTFSIGSTSTEGIVIGPGCQSVTGPPKVTAIPILPGKYVKVQLASGTTSGRLSVFVRSSVA